VRERVAQQRKRAVIIVVTNESAIRSKKSEDDERKICGNAAAIMSSRDGMWCWRLLRLLFWLIFCVILAGRRLKEAYNLIPIDLKNQSFIF
jgi:hypothetical protein